MITFPPPAEIVSTVLNIIGFAGSLAEDQVAVFDASYNQIFPMARAVKANVMLMTKLMDHPIEDGSIRTDFRIVMPAEIDLSVICSGDDYADVYQQIKTSYLSGDIFTVQTKADTYFNMMFQSIPHEESPDMFDVLAVGVRMREVLIVETQYQALPADQVQNTNDQSTVETGTTAPTATVTSPSLLTKLVDAVK